MGIGMSSSGQGGYHLEFFLRGVTGCLFLNLGGGAWCDIIPFAFTERFSVCFSSGSGERVRYMIPFAFSFLSKGVDGCGNLLRLD